MKFEIKRFFYGRDIFYFAFGSLFFIVLTAVDIYIVQPHFSGNHSVTIDYYNAVTQCMPFVFAPVAGVFFSKDLEKNVTIFYRSYDITLARYILQRVGTSFFGGSIFIFCESVALIAFVEQAPTKALEIGCFLLLDFLYFLFLSCLIAIVFKNRTLTVFAIIGSTFILSILNIMPIPLLKGNIFMLDGNSFLTNRVTNYVEAGVGSFIGIVGYQSIEIIIIASLLLFLILSTPDN